jgi:hypothetical protein
MQYHKPSQTLAVLTVCHCDKYLKSFKGGTVYLGSQFRCFSPGHLALMLLACGYTVHHGRSAWWRRSVHLMESGKLGKREEGPRVPIPFKGTPPMTHLPFTSFYLPKVLPSPNSTRAGQQFLNTWAFVGYSISKL